MVLLHLNSQHLRPIRLPAVELRVRKTSRAIKCLASNQEEIVNDDEFLIETLSRENDSDFTQWATAPSREMSDDKIVEATNALGELIIRSYLKVFLRLVPGA